jgi:hypothetical protein
MHCHAIISAKRENNFGKIFEIREGFCFVIYVTGLNMPNTGMGNDDDDSLHLYDPTAFILFSEDLMLSQTVCN